MVVKKTSIKGIVFDKDGTLFDFNATWGAWSAQLISQECGGDAALMLRLSSVLGFDLQTRRFDQGSIVIASTVDEVADAILLVLPQNRTKLIERMKTAATTVPQQPAADLPALLSNLRRRDLMLGIATNDAEMAARAHLTQSGVVEAFDLILGYDSGHGGKPAPGQRHAFCKATRLAPAECAMVGDSLHDLHAGRAAGMTTIGVLTGPAPAEELEPAADVILPDVGALPDWLDS